VVEGPRRAGGQHLQDAFLLFLLRGFFFRFDHGLHRQDPVRVVAHLGLLGGDPAIEFQNPFFVLGLIDAGRQGSDLLHPSKQHLIGVRVVGLALGRLVQHVLTDPQGIAGLAFAVVDHAIVADDLRRRRQTLHPAGSNGVVDGVDVGGDDAGEGEVVQETAHVARAHDRVNLLVGLEDLLLHLLELLYPGEGLHDGLHEIGRVDDRNSSGLGFRLRTNDDDQSKDYRDHCACHAGHALLLSRDAIA
jgi:hypothetical protein